jgi:hypothetical protein
VCRLSHSRLNLSSISTKTCEIVRCFHVDTLSSRHAYTSIFLYAHAPPRIDASNKSCFSSSWLAALARFRPRIAWLRPYTGVGFWCGLVGMWCQYKCCRGKEAGR